MRVLGGARPTGRELPVESLDELVDSTMLQIALVQLARCIGSRPGGLACQKLSGGIAGASNAIANPAALNHEYATRG